MISWSEVLGSQEDSLERQLARRDMAKLNQLLLNVAGQAEQQRANKADEEHRAESLAENVRLREAQQNETLRLREEMKAERERDNKLALYGQVSSGRKPGDRVGKSALDVIAEFEGGTGDYSPDPDDPLQHIYKAEEAKRLLAKAESDERVRVAQEADRKRRLELAEEENQRQRKELAIREKETADKQKDAVRKQEAHEKRMAKYAKEAESLPQPYASQVMKLTEEIMEENAGKFFGIGPEGEFAAREAAVAEAVKRLRAKIPGHHGVTTLMPPQPQPQGNEFLTPEEMKANPAFAGLPPGTKVRRK